MSRREEEREILNADYLCPDLHKMYHLRFMHRSAKSSQYAVLIAAGSLLIATISLIVAIVK